jgi:hypothetical protein
MKTRTVLSLVLLFASTSAWSSGGVVVMDHSSWNSLLQRYVNPDGKVDYSGFKGDRLFSDYINELKGSHPDESWTRNEQMAYWINAYNAFTIQLITQNMPLKSIKDISEPWDNKFIIIEGKNYSLNDIENRILRRDFKDPRIHFAVNCASISCPKLWNKAYTASNLDSSLEKRTREFINDPKFNIIKNDEIVISQIFDWYSEDFKSNGSVISYLNRYSKVVISPESTVDYGSYNWSLNN